MRVWPHLCVGQCEVPGGAVVANTLPPIAGRDPAGSNACSGEGIAGGSEFSGGEEEGDVEDFFHQIVRQLSP